MRQQEFTLEDCSLIRASGFPSPSNQFQLSISIILAIVSKVTLSAKSLTNIWLIFICVVSTTFLGVGFLLLVGQDSGVTGVLLAISAGMFLYLGASDFLPHIHEGKISHQRSTAALLIGVIVMIATFTLIPHS